REHSNKLRLDSIDIKKRFYSLKRRPPSLCVPSYVSYFFIFLICTSSPTYSLSLCTSYFFINFPLFSLNSSYLLSSSSPFFLHFSRTCLSSSPSPEFSTSPISWNLL